MDNQELIKALRVRAAVDAENLSYHGGGARKEDMLTWKAADRLEELMEDVSVARESLYKVVGQRNTLLRELSHES